MPLSLEDRRKLVDLLSVLSPFQDIDGRRAVLFEAGLEIFIPRVNFSLAAGVFVGLLVSQLEQYGTMESTGKPALNSLLRWADDPAHLGIDDRNFIRRLLALPPLDRENHEESEAKPGTSGKIVILFLAASPTDQGRIRFDVEFRAIDKNLQATQYRDRFVIQPQMAVRASDLQNALLRFQPHIVHFSGHGSENGIVLEAPNGKAYVVPAEALSELFAVLKDNIRCVVLNACLSENQAQGIAQSIDCVVGMSHEIGDNDAIVFASAFYEALGFGRDIQTAFRLGKTSIHLEGLPDSVVPRLICREGVDPSTIKFT